MDGEICWRKKIAAPLRSQPREIFRQRGQVLDRSRDHQVAHSGVIAAGPGAELGHAPGKIIAALTGQARHRAVALEMVEMTAGAADRAVCGPGTLSDVFRRARLAKIRPRLLREVFGNRQHLVAFENRGDRLMDLALAVAALEIAELDVEITCLLSPDIRNGLVDRLAIFAVAAGAELNFLVQPLRA